jgi:hypothetical protein
MLRLLGRNNNTSVTPSSEQAGVDEELNIKGVYSGGDLLDTIFEPGELIMHGLYRGELGIVNAIPNAGKSTLMLNASICLSVGRPFPPLVTYEGKPRRIIYVDCENRPYRLQSDLAKMLLALTPQERELCRANFMVCVDFELGNEPFNLTNPTHLNVLARVANRHKADLIIVDTLASASSLYDENNNAEVGRKILRPLKQVQTLTNAAVILIDHKGKRGSEFGNENTIYAGRGASAKAGSARLIINLDPDPKDTGTVLLSNPKNKTGAPFEETLLRLDRETRWFSPLSHKRAKEQSNYELVVDFVRLEGAPTKRAAIIEKFMGVMSQPTVARALSDAVERGVLKQSGYGQYEAVEGENG